MFSILNNTYFKHQLIEIGYEKKEWRSNPCSSDVVAGVRRLEYHQIGSDSCLCSELF